MAGPTPAAFAEPSEASHEALVQRLQEILRAPVLSDALVGVHVRSISTGKTLFERNGTKLFNPASNVKLITSAAALHYLGGNYRFRTTAYRDRNLKNGVLDGNLYIVGRGDPTLTNELLFGFINEIALRGIQEIKGDVVVDESFFDSVYEGPGWEQERSDKSYAPPVAALSANFGNYSIRVVPGDRVGAPARVSVYPDVPSVQIADRVFTRGRRARSRVWVGTSRESNGSVGVTVRGSVAVDDIDGATVYKPVYDPSRYAGEVLVSLLEMRGVRVKGRVRIGNKPRGVVPVASHYSQPLAAIVSTLNKYSNNFIAEMILKTLGAEIQGEPGTWAKGCDTVGAFLSEIGIPRDGFVMGNGSGLNDINRLTPQQVTLVLQKMYERFELRPEFVASLAVAGVSGTITRRFDDEPAEARLRAKTGSLRGVSALSGYVITRDNQMLAFSVMMNDYRGRARSMWSIQDEIGNALADMQRADVIAQP